MKKYTFIPSLKFLFTTMFTGVGLFFVILGIFIVVALFNLYYVRFTYCRVNCIKNVVLGQEFTLIRKETARLRDIDLEVTLTGFLVIDRTDLFLPMVQYEILSEGIKLKKQDMKPQFITIDRNTYQVEPFETDWETFVRFRISNELR